jgi:hypothetical protein
MAKSRGRKFAEITSPASGVFDLTSVPTITNAKLQNSAMTLAGSSVSLGGTGVADTDALSEGSSNVYFTDARVQTFLGGGTLAGNIVVPDNRSIYLGSSSDFRMVHNTTNTQLINATGALQITSNGGFDVTGAATFSSTITATGTITGTLATAAQTNITSVGTLTGLTVTNPIAGSVTGTAATVTGAAQTNITSVGTLTGLAVAGDTTITKESPAFTLTDSSSSRTLLHFVDDNNSVVRASGPLLIQSGGAVSAITLDTSQNATFAGNITLSGTLNGITTTQSVSGNRWGVLPEVASNGVLEIGRYVDFHATDGDTSDYGARFDYDGSKMTLTSNFEGSGTIRGTRLGGNADPNANYAVNALQNGSMTHAGYFQANGDDIGVEIKATAGSYSSTALLVSQPTVASGGFLARFANSAGNKLTIGTDGAVNIAGNATSTGVLTSNHIIRSDAGHSTARVEAVYDDQNSTYPQYNGSILMWASEPGITYDSGGIGVNVNAGGQYYGRRYNYGYATYMRFIKTNGDIAFYHNQGTAGTANATQTETFRIAANGTLKIAAGGGVNFGTNPDTTASGASASAEILDDYEEGSWTPRIEGASGGNCTMNSANMGRYVKVGAKVTVNGTIGIGSVPTLSGSIVLTGLPFPSKNESNYRSNAAPVTNTAINPGTGMTMLGIGVDANLSYAWVVGMNPVNKTYTHTPTVGAGNLFGFSMTYITDS